MARKERALLKYLASAIFFIIGLVLILDATRTNQVDQAAQQVPAPRSQTKASSSTVAKPTIDTKKSSGLAAGSLCRNVLETCTARIAFQSNDCNKKAAKIEVEQLLLEPLKNIHCQDIYDRMEDSCPEGCRIDAARSITLPADVQFRFDDDERDISGCQVSGDRLVNIRGVCVSSG